MTSTAKNLRYLAAIFLGHVAVVFFILTIAAIKQDSLALALAFTPAFLLTAVTAIANVAAAVNPSAFTLSDEDAYRDSRGKLSCSLCGSRNWPSATSSCPQCRAETTDPEDEEP